MVSTHLKNISQNGNLPQIGVKIKHIWNLIFTNGEEQTTLHLHRCFICVVHIFLDQAFLDKLLIHFNGTKANNISTIATPTPTNHTGASCCCISSPEVHRSRPCLAPVGGAEMWLIAELPTCQISFLRDLSWSHMVCWSAKHHEGSFQEAWQSRLVQVCTNHVPYMPNWLSKTQSLCRNFL